MSEQRKDRYLFLTTFVRASETKMLTNDRLERVLDTPTFEEAAKILAECGYQDMSEMSQSEIEQELAAHRVSIFSELVRLSPEKEIIDAFRIKYDYHNAKVLIKAEGAKADGEHILSDSGRVPVRVLKEAFREGNYIRIPMALSEAMREARETMARTANPQLVDFELDKAYFAELMSMAKKVGSAFLIGYARTLIDSANLRSVVRTMRMGRDMDFLKAAFIPGGNVGEKRLAAVELSNEGLVNAFSMSAFKEAAVLGGEAINGGSLTKFEQACDNAVTAYLRKAKSMGYGDDPVIGYLAAVESELIIVRMILTGRKAGIDPAQIKERLRDIYV